MKENWINFIILLLWFQVLEHLQKQNVPLSTAFTLDMRTLSAEGQEQPDLHFEMGGGG
jgi:hypothetical protein